MSSILYDIKIRLLEYVSDKIFYCFFNTQLWATTVITNAVHQPSRHTVKVMQRI